MRRLLYLKIIGFVFAFLFGVYAHAEVLPATGGNLFPLTANLVMNHSNRLTYDLEISLSTAQYPPSKYRVYYTFPGLSDYVALATTTNPSATLYKKANVSTYRLIADRLIAGRPYEFRVCATHSNNSNTLCSAPIFGTTRMPLMVDPVNGAPLGLNFGAYLSFPATISQKKVTGNEAYFSVLGNSLPSTIFKAASYRVYFCEVNGDRCIWVNRNTSPYTVFAGNPTQPNFEVGFAWLTAGMNYKIAICATSANNQNQVCSNPVLFRTAGPDPIYPREIRLGIANLVSAPEPETNSRTAKFTFTSTELQNEFECRMDSESFSSCQSAAEYSNLNVGTHLFEVRAVDSLGNASSPVRYSWEVISTCGDGLLDGNEICDEGIANGTVGHCNSTCDGVIPIPPVDDDILFESTFDDLLSLTNPIRGLGAEVFADFADGYEGDGVEFLANGDYISIPNSNINLNQGEIEFWYQPNYATSGADSDDVTHTLVSVGDAYIHPMMRIVESDSLRVSFYNADWTSANTASNWHQNLWSAGDWVNIRVEWDNTDATDSLRLFVNDERIGNTVSGGWNVGNIGDAPLTIGGQFAGGQVVSPAMGVIDELVIHGQPTVAATTTTGSSTTTGTTSGGTTTGGTTGTTGGSTTGTTTGTSTTGSSTSGGTTGSTTTTGGTTTGTATGSTTGGGVIPFPGDDHTLDFTVSDTVGIARSGEMVRTGLPLSRALNVTSTSRLAVVDSNQNAVPAEFRILARWNAGLNVTSAPIQWVLVVFPASVSANQTSVYRLITDGSVANPAPAQPLTLTQSGNQITVNTGAAVFRLGTNVANLFDEVSLGNGTSLLTGAGMNGRVGVNGSATNFANTNHTSTARRVYIEHQGPLSAVVVMEGVYDHANVGGGGIGSTRRYIFSAGSPTAVVRHAVKWEGSLCSMELTSCNGAVNGLRLGGLSDLLDTSGMSGSKTVQVLGTRSGNLVEAAAAPGEATSLRQLLRTNRTSNRAFSIQAPGVNQSGVAADGGMLTLSGSNGSVGIALNHMHRYEPQALRLLANGRLSVDLIDTEGGQAWLGNHQGMFATLAVTAMPTQPTRNELDQTLWAPLNAPLTAWPSARWFNESGAVDEIPVGTLPASVANYDTFLPNLLNSHMQKLDQQGFNGLMTYGVTVREWGAEFNEIDCNGSDDPTPTETWDNAYWCGFWTDYHNSSNTVNIWAMRSGQTRWLDEMSKPAALRTLHTQIMQCSPTDSWFYCGQAPTGYRGYRSDNNGSHAYFDNLFMYYWLTGDSTVTNTLTQGANNMRNYVCSNRNSGNGAACSATAMTTDYWAQFTGRVAMQWTNAFRFLGHAIDASYLEDFRSNLARAVTQNYLQVSRNGTTYGFWTGGASVFVGDELYNYSNQTTVRVNANGTGSSDQLWMVSLYDMNTLYRLQIDTNDAPIGTPAIRPSEVIRNWSNTMRDYGSRVLGTGTAASQWPNALNFQYSGSRIGGTLVSVTANLGGSDPYLYAEGKACLSAAVLRSADLYGDASLESLGQDLTAYGLNAAATSVQTLDKSMGINISRLHSAAARLAND